MVFRDCQLLGASLTNPEEGKQAGRQAALRVYEKESEAQELRAGAQGWLTVQLSPIPLTPDPLQPARDPQLVGHGALASPAPFGQGYTCLLTLQSPSFIPISTLCPCSCFHNKKARRN